MEKNNKRAFMYLAPCLMILTGLVLLPIVQTLRYSFMKYRLTEPNDIRGIGFKNYQQVLESEDFRLAAVNSLYVLVFVMIIGLVLSLAFALLLNRKTKLSPILMGVSIIPWALPPMVNGIIWQFIFYPGFGLVNKCLYGLGLIDAPIQWMNQRFVFLFVIALTVSWRIIPFSTLVFLANLQNIPQDYYRAFSVMGGHAGQAFRYITLPLLKPSFGVVLINLTTTALNVFDEVIAMGGYSKAGQTLMVFNYTKTFDNMDFGYGSAISYTIMILTGIFGYWYIKNMTGDIKKGEIARE